MLDPLTWQAGPLPGLLLAFDADGVQVGRVRQRANAADAHYDAAGLERPPGELGAGPPDLTRWRVASGVELHEARRAVERWHEARGRRRGPPVGR